MDTFRWAVGWHPPLTMSGMTNTTVLPGPASSFSGGVPMGFRREFRVAAYRLSQSWGRQGGSATVSPGMNTSVLSGSSAAIRPWPYSNSNFMGILPYLPR